MALLKCLKRLKRFKRLARLKRLKRQCLPLAACGRGLGSRLHQGQVCRSRTHCLLAAFLIAFSLPSHCIALSSSFVITRGAPDSRARHPESRSKPFLSRFGTRPVRSLPRDSEKANRKYGQMVKDWNRENTASVRPHEP